jgi:hypothetical protein
MSTNMSMSDYLNSTNNDTILNPNIASQVSNAFEWPSIIIISLIIVNLFAAVLSILLIVFDNYQFHNTWVITPSRRIPLSIALAIVVSHSIFVLQAFNALAALDTVTLPKMKTLACRVVHELAFAGLQAC